MPLLGFLGFALSIWVASWIFAWLLHIGRGSLLVVIVFHAWFDIVTNSPLGPPLLPTAMGAAVTVVGLVVLHRLMKLSRQDGTGRPKPSAQMPKEADSENDLRQSSERHDSSDGHKC